MHYACIDTYIIRLVRVNVVLHNTWHNFCLRGCHQYQKPEELLRFEQAVRVELAKVKSSGDGDVQMCSPS